MKYGIDILKLIKHIIPHFLQGKLGSGQAFETESQGFWVTALGSEWGTSSDNSRHLDWIKALVAPIQNLNKSLVDFVAKIRYEANLSGQVIYLEHYLNDIFDSGLRRIYISDASIVLPPYIYNEAEGEENLELYNTSEDKPEFYLYTKSDYYNVSEFTIFVPSSFPLTNTLINQISSAVNKYKQAGVRFDIQNY